MAFEKLESGGKMEVNGHSKEHLPRTNLYISVNFYLVRTAILRLWALLLFYTITFFFLFSLKMYYLGIKEASSNVLKVPDVVAQLVNCLFYEHHILI